ncbi:MAG TPA: TA system VapC family ribonuclease toxin [Verrucomicrobiae bacterium]|nr:TA system VapC family ribonuclease toxin [Verrucomicrobiae bacterium]
MSRKQLSGCEPVALCWPVLTAFLRIGTNARLHRRPLSLREALDRVQSWLEQPCVQVIHPGERHWDWLQQALLGANATANLVSDAHLAAMAQERNATLVSTDTNFARFRRLKWMNPVSS